MALLALQVRAQLAAPARGDGDALPVRDPLVGDAAQHSHTRPIPFLPAGGWALTLSHPARQVMLLNMLIAMMGVSFQRVFDKLEATAH